MDFSKEDIENIVKEYIKEHLIVTIFLEGEGWLPDDGKVRFAVETNVYLDNELISQSTSTDYVS